MKIEVIYMKNLASGKSFQLVSNQQHISINNDRMCQLLSLPEGS